MKVGDTHGRLLNARVSWGYTMATANNITLPIGIIDIGSNSVRLLITDGVFFKKYLITTRLGEGAGKEKILTSDAITRTVNAINTFYIQAEQQGAKTIVAFATQAVRGAKNKSEFLKRVFDETKLNVDVLSGDKEAEIGLLGANLGESGGIVDIGGASTEIAVVKGESVVYKKSVEIGAVSLNDKFGQDKERIKEYCALKLKEFSGADMVPYKAIGGTATALASIDLGLKVYDATKTHNHYLLKKNLTLIESDLYAKSQEEILKKYAISKSRAQIIAGGCTLLIEVLNTLNLDGVIVSESDNLEGYFYSIRG